MSNDRALQRRALRKLVDIRFDAMEDESENGGVTVVAIADELEATLESNDVRFRPEVVAELWIEQPRRAGRKTRRRVGEMACEEWLSSRERVVACPGRERSALRYVDVERRLAGVRRVAHSRPARVPAVELKTTALVDGSATVEREAGARP